MSDEEAALALDALRRLTFAMNAGDDGACLAGMTDKVVIVDDVAPFSRTGRKEAEKWLLRIAETRRRLLATLSLEAAQVRVAEGRAYIVAPGVLKGALLESDFEIEGLVTSTLVERDGKWLVDSLIWAMGGDKSSEPSQP